MRSQGCTGKALIASQGERALMCSAGRFSVCTPLGPLSGHQCDITEQETLGTDTPALALTDAVTIHTRPPAWNTTHTKTHTGFMQTHHPNTGTQTLL